MGPSVLLIVNPCCLQVERSKSWGPRSGIMHKMVNYEVKIVFQWARGLGWGDEEVSEGDEAREPSRAAVFYRLCPAQGLPIDGVPFTSPPWIRRNAYPSESVIVFWQAPSKVSFFFLMALVCDDTFLTGGKRCLLDEVPLPRVPKALALARRGKR